MEEMTKRIENFAKENNLTLTYTSSYFKLLLGKTYIMGGRVHKKYLRLWIKADLDMTIDKFPEGRKPGYEELHKHYKWLSYDIYTTSEFDAVANLIKNNSELFAFNLNQKTETDSETTERSSQESPENTEAMDEAAVEKVEEEQPKEKKNKKKK